MNQKIVYFFMALLIIQNLSGSLLLQKKPTNLVKKARRLGEIETLQEEAQEKANYDNTRLLMTNMQRDNEIKQLESIISEIGEHVDQINDTVNAKTMEFMDTVDRIVNSRNSRSDIYSVKPSA